MDMLDNKMKWEKMKTANVVSGVIMAVFTMIVALLFFIEIPAGNKDILNTTISFFMGTGVAGVVYFLFGWKGNKGAKQVDLFDDKDVCIHCNKTVGGELPEGDPDE